MLPATRPRLGILSVALFGFLALVTAKPCSAANALAGTVTLSRGSGLFTDSFTLTMSGAAVGENIRYTLTLPSSAGSTAPAPSASSSEYTAPISVSSPVIVSAAVFSADDSQSGAVTTAAYLPVVDSGSTPVAHFTTQMPVIVLDDHGFGALPDDGTKFPGWIYHFVPGTDGLSHLDQPATLATPISFGIHGSSSASFPKKSFNINLETIAGKKLAEPLFDFSSSTDSDPKWDLVSPWYYDRAYVRNAFVYALSNAIGRWAPRTRAAEVFFKSDNGPLSMADYVGITQITDRLTISSDRINIASISSSDVTPPAITGGYILKIDYPDSDAWGWTTNQGVGIQVDTPEAVDLPQAQRDYIQGYVQQMEDAIGADSAANWTQHTYGDYLDRDSWVDFHLINVFVKNVDAFVLSTYFTKDTNGKIVAGPVWDYDRSMGSYDGRDVQWDSWSAYAPSVDVWNTGWWGTLARDPDFMQAWVDRWQSLRRNQLATSSLTSLVDSVASQIDPAAAARDIATWGYDTTWDAEIAHLKDWLTNRAAWIDAQFVAVPTVQSRGGLLCLTPPVGSQLAYTLDGTDPRAGGGQLSSTAYLTQGPVVLADSPQVCVRSYSAAQQNVFPGSPWSMMITPDAEVALSDNQAGVTLRANVILASVGGPLALSDATPNAAGWQWLQDGVPIPDATGAVLNLSAIVASNAGTYTVEALNTTGAVIGTAEFSLQVTMLPPAADELANASGRAWVGTGDNILINGFVIGGNTPKTVLIRGAGPTLANFGIGSPLAAPSLTLFSGGTVLARNAGWSTAPNAVQIATVAQQFGAFAFPDGSADSALLVTLRPGAYTVEVAGADGGTGIALAEIYSTDSAPSTSRLVNLSSRVWVGSNAATGIAGFIVNDPNSKTILVRAVGPGLGPFGINGFLADPKIDIHATINGQDTIVASNDNWGGDPALAAAFQSTGAFALDPASKDAALLVTLPPGAYTAQVTGADGGSGVALIEVYDTP